MKGRFVKALGTFQRGEKGITGLETAIILIAFVTVAAVLAYSVLSAGIFSSERGQEAVYRGLEQAQASMQVSGNVYACGNTTNALNVSFQLATVLDGEDVDLDKVIVNYQDTDNVDMNISGVTGLTGTLEPNEVQQITIDLTPYLLTTYDEFTIEIIPPTGASIQIKRTLPGEIETVMNLY